MKPALPDTPITQELIPVKQASHLLGVSVETTRSYCRYGTLVGIKNQRGYWYVNKLEIDVLLYQQWLTLSSYLLKGYKLISIDGYKAMDNQYWYVSAMLGIWYQGRLHVLLYPDNEVSQEGSFEETYGSEALHLCYEHLYREIAPHTPAIEDNLHKAGETMEKYLPAYLLAIA